MKCRKCRGSAVIKMPRHNTSFCNPCFQDYLLKQVAKAIHDGKMFDRSAPVLVAVSGGKDSLALWDILDKLGYKTVGLYLNLGIGDYSNRSRDAVERFATSRDFELIIHDYKESYGLGVVEIASQSARPACSACGTMKRHHFNRIAMEKGFPVVATGHNLDDEAARLLGNLLTWQVSYLEKQSPVLSDDDGQWAKKVKPLYRLPEREMAAYAILNRIDYVVEECPMSKGAKTFGYKETLNQLEENSPGAKHSFYFGFLKQKEKSFPTPAPETIGGSCESCGQPSSATKCGYCRLLEKATATVS